MKRLPACTCVLFTALAIVPIGFSHADDPPQPDPDGPTAVMSFGDSTDFGAVAAAAAAGSGLGGGDFGGSYLPTTVLTN